MYIAMGDMGMGQKAIFQGSHL